jgi:hypothetical protein
MARIYDAKQGKATSAAQPSNRARLCCKWTRSEDLRSECVIPVQRARSSSMLS